MKVIVKVRAIVPVIVIRVQKRKKMTKKVLIMRVVMKEVSNGMKVMNQRVKMKKINNKENLLILQ
jgi:hypothetical protein